jgi:ribonuclease D
MDDAIQSLSRLLTPLLEHEEGDIKYLRAVYPDFRRELEGLVREVTFIISKLGLPCQGSEADFRDYHAYSDQTVLKLLDEALGIQAKAKSKRKGFSLDVFNLELPKGPRMEPIVYPSHPFEKEIQGLSFSSQCFSVDLSATFSFDVSAPFEPAFWVDSEGSLKEMLDALASQSEIAVDLENHSYLSYHGYSCLMQISTRTRDYLVDSVKLRREIPQYLAPIFQNTQVLKIFHGAESDIAWLQRDFGIFPLSVFDSYHASKKLDLPRQSLAFLVDHFFGVSLDKQYQTADWRIRPLPQDMLRYAQIDTRCLFPLYDTMRQAIMKRFGKDGLVQVLCKSSLQALKLFAPEPLDSLVRKNLKFISNRKLSKEEHELASGLISWREQVAIEEDVSPHAICSIAVLTSIFKCRRVPHSMEERLKPPPVKSLMQILHREHPIATIKGRDSTTIVRPTKRIKIQEKHVLLPKVPTSDFTASYNIPHSPLALIEASTETTFAAPDDASLSVPETNVDVRDSKGSKFTLDTLNVEPVCCAPETRVEKKSHDFPRVGLVKSASFKPHKHGDKRKRKWSGKRLDRPTGSKITNFKNS